MRSVWATASARTSAERSADRQKLRAAASHPRFTATSSVCPPAGVDSRSMARVLDHPAQVFALAFVLLWVATQIGVFLRRRTRNPAQHVRDDFSTVQAATLTLTGLIIGLTFSMAVNRYELRKSYEEAEANAIGTEYLRTDLLPAGDAAKLRPLLQDYLAQRISFYIAVNGSELREANARTALLNNELWAAIRGAAAAQPTPTIALVVAGMNDVLNSQGYTQAAWWNRIPTGAW